MSSGSRVPLCLLVLTLSLVSMAPLRVWSQASPPISLQSSDETALRGLTEQYGQALASGDLEKIREFWEPKSPDLATRLGFYQSFFATSRFQFLGIKITRADVTGEKAATQLRADERLLDKATGTPLMDRDVFHGAVRLINWTKTGAGWKIERESLLQEDLAVDLERSASDTERRILFENKRDLITDVLVRILIDRSTRHRLSGEFEAAALSVRLAQQVAEQIDDKIGTAKTWLYLAMVKDAQGDVENVLPLRERALALYTEAGSKLGEAIALFTVAHTYHQIGNYPKAFECALKSLHLAEELKHRSVMAHALSEMGHVYMYQNDDEQALVYFEKALSIFQELGDKIQIAIARVTIVYRHEHLGNYDQALQIYNELLKQTERRGDQIGGAELRYHIGNVHRFQGRYAEAMEDYRKSLEVSDARNFASTSIPTLIALSGLYLAEDKYEDALPLAERAASLSRQILDQRSLNFALASLGYCHLGLNHHAEARRAFAEAISTIEELRAKTTGGIEERQHHFELMLDGFHGMLSLMVSENQPVEALVYAERSKARGLLDMLQQGRANIHKAMTGGEQNEERRLNTELTRLNLELSRAGQPLSRESEHFKELQKKLERARLEYEAFQNALYTSHPELKIQRGEAPVINLKELTDLLPDASTALVEYVVTEDRIYLFTITRAAGAAQAEIKVHVLPIKKDELARQTESFRRQLAARDLGFRVSGSKLYKLLLKPAEAELQGKTNLIIAPDDTLWDLPFQALMNGANRFLIEDAAIAYAPSLTVLREMTKRRNNQHPEALAATLLAVGNPLVRKETMNHAALTLRDGKLDRLPEAEQEVRALRQLYGASQSKVYIGAEAREDRVKREAGQARILHFATHGMLNNASPMYSHLALAEGDANEDGLLEAWELMQLDLKADLAVLSACETARGHVGAGEGMIGLSWAMFIAGVPSIVVTQWKVESAGTRDLMVNFHRGLISRPAGGKPKPTKSEALRRAALGLLKNPATRHPFYWAGFVLVGDGG